MPVNFFDPNTQQPPQVDPQQAMAMQLMQRGMQSPQGQNVNGHYVAPPAGAYASQLANALAGGVKSYQARDGMRAQDVLNGGTGQSPLGSAMSGIGNWFGGLGGS